MSQETARAHLRAAGLEDRIRVSEADTATVATAAAAFGVAPAQIAKTLSFLVNGKAVLVLAALSLPGRTGDEFGLMLLTLGGLIVYTLLFEARARYLYIYVPNFLLLAARGAEERTGWGRKAQ